MLLLIIDSWSQKQKCFSLQKMLTDGLESCGLLVDYCDVFIRCLDSDGTHSLQSIHSWASDVMLNFQQICIFAWTIPLSFEAHVRGLWILCWIMRSLQVKKAEKHCLKQIISFHSCMNTSYKQICFIISGKNWCSKVIMLLRIGLMINTLRSLKDLC